MPSRPGARAVIRTAARNRRNRAGPGAPAGTAAATAHRPGARPERRPRRAARVTLRGLRVDDYVPAEQHAADNLPNARERILRADGGGGGTGGIRLGYTPDCRRHGLGPTAGHAGFATPFRRSPDGACPVRGSVGDRVANERFSTPPGLTRIPCASSDDLQRCRRTSWVVSAGALTVVVLSWL